MKTAVLLAIIAPLALAAPLADIVSHVNAKQKSWVATADSAIAKMPYDLFLTRLGVNTSDRPTFPRRTYPKNAVSDAPEQFDSRTNWPYCETMKEIRNQGNCGSCWAFSSAEAISDRECIASKENVRISAEDINSCAVQKILGMSMSCGSCNGGNLACAYNYWQQTGVVSDGCSPYTVPECGGTTGIPCPSEPYPTPACAKQCSNESGLVYNSDKHKAKNVYVVSGEADMIAEISQNGPCAVGFTVYEDFRAYKSGVYHHVTGEVAGGHGVKIIGYGVDNGTPYWTVANSWGPDWGEQGFFRILRGKNECGFEDYCYAGIAAPY